MKLFKFSLVVTLLAVLGSCQLAKFDRVPGEELGNIPVELHGKYAMATKDLKGILATDTVNLEIANNTIQLSGKGINITKIHDQDYKMAKFRGYTIIALNDATLPALWNMILIEKNSSGVRVYPLIDKRNNADEPGKMGQHMPQQILNITSEPIPPSTAPMTETGAAPINSPNQGLPPKAYFYTMMEDQFAEYLKLEVMSKEFLQFNKVEIKAKKK